MQTLRKKGQIIGLVLVLLPFFVPSILTAHPGRLDKNGCHQVREDYTYKDGKVLKAGEYHCHRPLGGMRLDGKEMLQEENKAPEKACLDRAIGELKSIKVFFDYVLKWQGVVVKADFEKHHREILEILKDCRE